MKLFDDILLQKENLEIAGHHGTHCLIGIGQLLELFQYPGTPTNPVDTLTIFGLKIVVGKDFNGVHVFAYEEDTKK